MATALHWKRVIDHWQSCCQDGYCKNDLAAFIVLGAVQGIFVGEKRWSVVIQEGVGEKVVEGENL